jgi:uroporphyrinogen decarboxylase
VSCDTATPLELMQELAGKVVVQGNLDPLVLAAGGQRLPRETRKILNALENRPHIFNLGHGVLPQTPPEHVARLVKLVRERK